MLADTENTCLSLLNRKQGKCMKGELVKIWRGQTREEVDFHGNTLAQNMLTMNLPFASQVV